MAEQFSSLWSLLRLAGYMSPSLIFVKGVLEQVSGVAVTQEVGLRCELLSRHWLTFPCVSLSYFSLLFDADWKDSLVPHGP